MRWQLGGGFALVVATGGLLFAVVVVDQVADTFDDGAVGVAEVVIALSRSFEIGALDSHDTVLKVVVCVSVSIN